MTQSSMHKRRDQFSLAFVTGASSGIGEALARLLAQHGIPLLLSARDPARLQAVAEELGNHVPVTMLIADLSTEEGRKGLLDKVRDLKPDLVVNNAGFGLYGKAITHETTENLEMINLNIGALLELTLESAKTLIAAKKKGVILNVSSASDQLVFPGIAIYAATKGFVTQVSQSLDVEFEPDGIRVLAACPGVVRTGFRKRASSGRTQATDGPIVMEAAYAASQLWWQIVKRKRVHYFDWRTRAALFFVRYFVPQVIVSRFLLKKIETIKSDFTTESQ